MDHYNELIKQIIVEIISQLNYGKDISPHQLMLSERAAAALLQVKPSTLQNWRCTGRYDLQYIKTGRLVRYRVSDLAQWLAKRRTGGD